MVRFLLAAAVLASAASTLFVAAAEPAPWSIVSAYQHAKLAGFGQVVEAKQIGRGDSAVFLYVVDYGPSRASVTVCAFQQLKIGSPLLFVLGEELSSPGCPQGSYFVPPESNSTFLMPGVEDWYSKKTYVRVRYPQDRSIGCALSTITASESSVRTDKQSQVEFGPFDISGKYFSKDDFLRCVSHQGKKESRWD